LIRFFASFFAFSQSEERSEERENQKFLNQKRLNSLKLIKKNSNWNETFYIKKIK